MVRAEGFPAKGSFVPGLFFNFIRFQSWYPAMSIDKFQHVSLVCVYSPCRPSSEGAAMRRRYASRPERVGVVPKFMNFSVMFVPITVNIAFFKVRYVFLVP